MNFGLSGAKFSAQYPVSYQKFDLSKAKIHDAQTFPFFLFLFLIVKHHFCHT